MRRLTVFEISMKNFYSDMRNDRIVGILVSISPFIIINLNALDDFYSLDFNLSNAKRSPIFCDMEGRIFEFSQHFYALTISKSYSVIFKVFSVEGNSHFKITFEYMVSINGRISFSQNIFDV
uniref:Transmembrane protein n=1 Tax=Parascaris univalens TaxID=6257 RepID=A0A915C230_PARUN